MDTDQARTFIAANHHAILSTLRSDGTPQLTMVAVSVIRTGWWSSTPGTALAVTNLRRDPQASVCAFTDRSAPLGPDRRSGPSSRAGPDGGLVDYFRRVADEPENWNDRSLTWSSNAGAHPHHDRPGGPGRQRLIHRRRMPPTLHRVSSIRDCVDRTGPVARNPVNRRAPHG
jgi:hypothetical protein